MTIPTSGQFTSEQVRAEWGFSLPMTSTQVSSAAGLNTPWSSDQLRGKSARTVTIGTAYRFIGQGGRLGFGYDQITFRIITSDGSVPSSYAWSGAVGGTAATTIFVGPSYSQDGFTFQNGDTAYCTVVINGQSYSREVYFTYTAGDAA